MISLPLTGGINAVWGHLLDVWPYSNRTLFVAVMWVSFEATWWLSNCFLTVARARNWFARYKIEASDPDPKLVRKTVLMSAASSLLSPYFLWYMMEPWATTNNSYARLLPPFSTLAWQLATFFLINDFLFYWGHRLLHHRRIYKFVHKQHHEYKSTIGFAATYAHPLEMLLANLIPTFLGPVLIKPHLVVMVCYVVVRMLETIDAHSGYEFPFSPFGFEGASLRHNFHHAKNTGNFGMFPWWDRICGTDQSYRRWLKKREARTD